MKSKRLDILLEHLGLNCRYHIEHDGTFCERAWANTERTVLKYVQCEGRILECELTNNDVMRRIA